jgi:aromatic ring-opening dioxygenase catalytic subunit (LigB family)
MPVVFVPHGGGPWPFVDLGFPKAEVDELAAYLRTVPHVPATAPAGLLVVSAHWEEWVPTVMTASNPPLLYDYYGFPPDAYRITWPAPGSPTLAARVRRLLASAGVANGEDATRGYDHGTFVPLKVAYPEPLIPTVQLSIVQSLDPAEHIALGKALSPLRDEGIFIICTGMSFHNLRAFFDGSAVEASEAFDGWLRESMALPPEARNEALTRWAQAPGARLSHPREDHLIPLMVAAGAAGEDAAHLAFNGTMLANRLSAFHFG